MTSSSSLTSKPSATPAISRIGRFYIKRELGRGAIGCVYLGHDPVIDRSVALKTFNTKLTASEKKQHEQQFINEARAAGRLSHPNIVTIYDASIENNASYIAMEYLDGKELSKLLDQGVRFKPEEVASVTWKIADALEYAHQHQVIHRDIKPSNIFMVRHNQPKIVDFGIARAPNRVPVESADPDNPHTLFQHNILGTPNYMSPEQALGEDIDARTDVYSLGAIMYEMLTGRRPFQTHDVDKLLQQIAHKAPPAPHEIDPMVPMVLSQIAIKAMSKRPEKRYQTAAEMMLEIKRYLAYERRAQHRSRKKSGEIPEDSSLPIIPPAPHQNISLWIALFVVLLVALTVWLNLR
jgi:eukaryotic-like serine/threonine-protein kinase